MDIFIEGWIACEIIAPKFIKSSCQSKILHHPLKWVTSIRNAAYPYTHTRTHRHTGAVTCLCRSLSAMSMITSTYTQLTRRGLLFSLMSDCTSVASRRCVSFDLNSYPIACCRVCCRRRRSGTDCSRLRSLRRFRLCRQPIVIPSPAER